jgi:2',3'-cyclic-nucleotide 2'-phosphodiesterase (5'-nucleotidase family)
MGPRDSFPVCRAFPRGRFRRGTCPRIEGLRRLRTSLLVAVLALFPASTLLAEQDVTFLLTSNLQGRFHPEAEGQDDQDPLLLIARGIIEERKSRIALYLDAGNAFYPGALSKFSFGSVVMEYFQAASCAATLVSSNDLRIGLDNLEALQEGRSTSLLSANLTRDGAPLFETYTISRVGDRSIAVVGVSSDRVLFDVAEKNLYNLDVGELPEAFYGLLRKIKDRGADAIVLLSGLSLKKTLALLTRSPEIDLAVCGGDNAGELYSYPTARVDTADGRTVVLLSEPDGYFRLDAVLGDSGIRVKELRKRTEAQLRAEAAVRRYSMTVPEYTELSHRILAWKEKFRQEGEDVLASTGRKALVLDDRKVSFLLRDRFNAEISFVDAATVHRSVWGEEVRRSDVMHAVRHDFNLFVYRLTGKQLKKVRTTAKSLIINGFDGKSVQGYRVEAKRKYRVASTQAVFDRVERILGERLPYENSWVTLTDLLVADLKGKGVSFRDDYVYLDRRFRTTVDFKLSNFFENASVSKGPEDKAPAGWPRDSYSQWGIENEIKVILYNHRHQFVLLPYICYQRTTDIYLKNILRGALFYNYNTLAFVKPYFKSQVETVVEEVEGRPVVIRETMGAYLSQEVWTAKLGVGMEKKVQDPAEDAFFGAEAQANVKLPVWKKIMYHLDVDSFLSLQSFGDNSDYLRAEVTNGLSVPVISHLDIGLKHRWFYFDSPEFLEDYSSSEVLTTLDFKMDAKLW